MRCSLSAKTEASISVGSEKTTQVFCSRLFSSLLCCCCCCCCCSDAHTSVWIAEAIALSVAARYACLVFFFLTRSHAHTESERERERL